MSASLASAAAATRAANATGGNAATGNTPARTSIGGDFNTFLTLLTTQLRNQSPTDPLDTNQMTAQLVQFASVEQQIAMNQNLAQMVNLQQVSSLASAAELVGRRVEMQSEQLSLQSGSAELRLPALGTAGAAQAARVSITDANDRVLRQVDVPLTRDARSWTWDGRNNAGVRLSDGAYRVSVGGVGADGLATSIAPSFTVVGLATAASRSGTTVNLNLGALSLPYGQLRSVAN